MPASAGILTLGCLAFLCVALLLWPRWPEVATATDAPPLPIVIAGVVFNVAPGAMRVPLQRHAGPQERVDLVYLWPDLAAPDPKTTSALNRSTTDDRIFVTIAGGDEKLPMSDRLKLIYPRYVEAWPIAGPDGLTVFAFRDDSPYRGEDLVLYRAAPEHFLARCSRDGGGPAPGTCLTERRVGEAEVTLRFPRSWIVDWRNVRSGIDRLMAQLH
jgi:hypothetical protein